MTAAAPIFAIRSGDLSARARRSLGRLLRDAVATQSSTRYRSAARDITMHRSGRLVFVAGTIEPHRCSEEGGRVLTPNNALRLLGRHRFHVIVGSLGAVRHVDRARPPRRRYQMVIDLAYGRRDRRCGAQ